MNTRREYELLNELTEAQRKNPNMTPEEIAATAKQLAARAAERAKSYDAIASTLYICWGALGTALATTLFALLFTRVGMLGNLWVVTGAILAAGLVKLWRIGSDLADQRKRTEQDKT